jgi:hypothetical protein
MKTKLNLTEELKENIRVRAKAHINSTDPCPDHWDSIETSDGFMDYNVWQNDDTLEWNLAVYPTFDSGNGYLSTDTANYQTIEL